MSDGWCLEHSAYDEDCAWKHDLPNKDDLPDPWPPARGDEDDEENE